MKTDGDRTSTIYYSKTSYYFRPVSFQLVACLFLSISLILFCAVRANGQGYKIGDRTRIFTEHLPGDSVVLKIENTLPIPVTVKLELNLKNLKVDSSSVLSAVISAKQIDRLVLLTRRDTAQPSILNYKWRVTYGDTSKVPDHRFAYAYPFKDWSYKISQGPNGSFSHKNIYAFDFQMPEGTPVVAVRDGIVAITRSDSDRGGANPEFTDDANFVSVYHSDGTLATYCHLKIRGVRVKDGESIKQGALIGYSGNTGFSSGPHLHFEITQADLQSDTKKWVKFKWKEAPDYLTANNPMAELFFKNFYYYKFYYSKI